MRYRLAIWMLALLTPLAVVQPARANGVSGFQINEAISTGLKIGSFKRAVALLNGQISSAGSDEFASSVVNFMHPGDFRHTRFPNTTPFQADAGPPGHNFALSIAGTITIPTAGWYTFGMTSDDNAILKLDGKLLVNSREQVPQSGLKSFDFTQPGEFSATITYFDYVGPSLLEFYASPGKFRSFHSRRANFQLVGDTADGGLAVGDDVNTGPSVGSGNGDGSGNNGTGPGVGDGNPGGSSVPEPGATAFVAVGLIGYLTSRKR